MSDEQIMTSWACLRLLHDLSKGTLTYANIAHDIGFADRSDDWRMCKPARIRNSNWWQDDPAKCWRHYRKLFCQVLDDYYGDDMHGALIAVRDALKAEHALVTDIQRIIESCDSEPCLEDFDDIFRVIRREAKPGRELLYRVRSESAEKAPADTPERTSALGGIRSLLASELPQGVPFPYPDDQAFADAALPPEIARIAEETKAGSNPALLDLLRNDSGLSLGKLESRCQTVSDLVGADETLRASYAALDELRVPASSAVRSAFRTYVDGSPARALAFAVLAALAGPEATARHVANRRQAPKG